MAVEILKGLYSVGNFMDVYKIAFPKTDNFYSKFSHVSILRYIKSHTFGLPVIRVWVGLFFSVPIVSIKLYGNILGRNESVSRKFATYNMLANKINTTGVKNRVTKLLKIVWFFPLVLIRSNFESVSLKAFTVVSAIYRTIFLCAEYWGANKGGIANLANQSDFVSSLMFVGTGNATCNRFFSTNLRNIKNSIADNARFINSHSLPINSSVFQKAKVRTILNGFYARFFNRNAAPNANKTSDGIFHKPMIAQTQKPVNVYEWQHKAQGSLFIPDTPRDAYEQTDFEYKEVTYEK